jgi:hypothetical protein
MIFADLGPTKGMRLSTRSDSFCSSTQTKNLHKLGTEGKE